LMSAASSVSTATADTRTASFGKLLDAAAAGQARLFVLMGQQEQRFAAEWASTVPAATSSASPAPAEQQPSQSPQTRPTPSAQPAVTPSGYTVENASRIFAELRLRKSPMEIALLQHAIDITNEAIERSWVAAAEAKWEYEIDAVVLYTFKLRNADHWGYPPIVGCGPNATTLHYEESQGPVKPGDLFLMDVGAEYEHYTADVTRTFPVSGKFTPAQAEIYQIVYDAQEAGAKAARPGKFVSDVDRAATEVIKDGLLKVGLITDRNSNQYRIWFMHGTSHWLGMNVHDVGFYGTKLEPGMIFTNEPGIYVRADALDYLPSGWLAADWEKFKAAVRPAFERHKNTGVRIEDDMLITAKGVEWMTKALPRKISELEDFIARARREAR
jgi:Xaa-Pro aminopeptidase